MTTLTDALNSVSAHRAGEVAFAAIDAIQGEPPAEQIAGAALLFQILLRRWRLDPRDVLPASGRRLEDALTPNPNAKPGEVVRALRAYVREDLS